MKANLLNIINLLKVNKNKQTKTHFSDNRHTWAKFKLTH